MALEMRLEDEVEIRSWLKIMEKFSMDEISFTREDEISFTREPNLAWRTSNFECQMYYYPKESILRVNILSRVLGYPLKSIEQFLSWVPEEQKLILLFHLDLVSKLYYIA